MSENLGLIGLGVAAAASFFYFNNNNNNNNKTNEAQTEEDKTKRSKKSADKKKRKKDAGEETIVVTETRTLEAHKNDDAAVSSGLDLGNIASRSITTARTGETTTIEDALKDSTATLPAELDPDYTVTSDATVTTQTRVLDVPIVTGYEVLANASVATTVDPTLEQVIEDVTATIPAAKVEAAEVEVITSSNTPSSSEEVVVEATKSRIDIHPQRDTTDLGHIEQTKRSDHVTDSRKVQLDDDANTASRKTTQKSKQTNDRAENIGESQTIQDTKTTLENASESAKKSADSALQSVKDTAAQTSETVEQSYSLETVKAAVGDFAEKVNRAAPLQTAKEAVQGAVQSVTDAVNQAAPVETVKGVAQRITDKVNEVAPVQTSKEIIQDNAQVVVDAVNEAAPIETTKATLRDIVNKASSVTQSTQSTIQDATQKVADTINDVAPLEKAKDVAIDTTNNAARIAQVTQETVQDTVQKTSDVINNAAPLETTKSVANDALNTLNDTAQTIKQVVSDKIQSGVGTVNDAAPIENTKAIANDAVDLAKETVRATGSAVMTNVKKGANAINDALPLETAKDAIDSAAANVNEAAQTTKDVVVEKLQAGSDAVNDAAPIETTKAVVNDATKSISQAAQTTTETVQDNVQQGVEAVQDATPIQTTKNAVQETSSKLAEKLDDIVPVQQVKKVVNDATSKVANVGQSSLDKEDEEPGVSAGNLPTGSSPSALSLDAPADWHLHAKNNAQASSSDTLHPLDKYAATPESKSEESCEDKVAEGTEESQEEPEPAVSAANPPTGETPSALTVDSPADWHLHPKHQATENASDDLVHPLDKYASTSDSMEGANKEASLGEKSEETETDQGLVSASNPTSEDSPSALSKDAPTDTHLHSEDTRPDDPSIEHDPLAKYAATDDSTQPSYLESAKKVVTETKDNIVESVTQAAPIQTVKDVTNDIVEKVSSSDPVDASKQVVNDVVKSTQDTINTSANAVAESEPLQTAKETAGNSYESFLRTVRNSNLGGTVKDSANDAAENVSNPETARSTSNATTKVEDEADKLTLRESDLENIDLVDSKKVAKYGNTPAEQTEASSTVQSVTQTANEVAHSVLESDVVQSAKDTTESAKQNLDDMVKSVKESEPVQNVAETISNTATSASEAEPVTATRDIVEDVSNKVAEAAQPTVETVKGSINSSVGLPSIAKSNVEDTPKYTTYEVREPFPFRSDAFHSTLISPLGLPSVPYKTSLSSQSTGLTTEHEAPADSSDVEPVSTSLEGAEQAEQSNETSREIAGSQNAIIKEASPASDEYMETSVQTSDSPTTVFLSQPDGWLEHGLHPKNLPNSLPSSNVTSQSRLVSKDIDLDDTKLAYVVKKSASALHDDTTSSDRAHGITKEILEKAETLVDNFFASPLNPKNMA